MLESENQHVDIFIPQIFFEHLPVYVLGLSENLGKNQCTVNCTISCLPEKLDVSLLGQTAEEINNRRTLPINSKLVACVGLVYNECQNIPYLSRGLKNFTCPTFVIAVSDVKKVTFINWTITNTQNLVPNSSVIIYNSYHLYDAEILKSGGNQTFVNFLYESCELTRNHASVLSGQLGMENVQFCVKEPSFLYVKTCVMELLITFLSMLCAANDYFVQRTPELLRKILSVTSTGKQLRCKSNHLKEILQDLLKNRNLTLLSGNLISALVLDAVCGLLVTTVFKDYLQPVTFLEAVIDKTDVVVSHLQQLLFWLMGVPAGLKLNLPLNSAMGRFFLYHIYLWKTYIVLLKPLLLATLELSMRFGFLGLSFLLSLCTDFLSLATLHIYCFYGYAARIYSLKLSGLIAFWRLFRGKKWNPLRNRVDSFTYDVQQLFIGTLIFTVMIFLLPTVALYYAVFSLLRVLILVLQIVLCKMIDVLTAFPLYTLLLHLLDHPFVKGDVQLVVVSSTKETLSLALKVIPISLLQVLQHTLPKQQVHINLGIKQLMNNLFFGKVIYPL